MRKQADAPKRNRTEQIKFWATPEEKELILKKMDLYGTGNMGAYHISKPLNLLRWIVWIGSGVGLLVCSIYLGDIFGITHMSMECVMLFVVFAIVTEPVLRYSTMFIERMGAMVASRRRKRAAR